MPFLTDNHSSGQKVVKGPGRRTGKVAPMSGELLVKEKRFLCEAFEEVRVCR